MEEPIKIKGVLHTDELIEELEKREPRRKNSLEHKQWRKDYNTVIDVMNRLAGFKRCLLLK